MIVGCLKEPHLNLQNLFIITPDHKFQTIQHILKCLLRVTPDLLESFAHMQVGETVDVGFRLLTLASFPFTSLLLLTLT